jgi:transposase
VEVNNLLEMKRQGLSIQAISAATGFDRKTIRKYLSRPEAIPSYAPRPPRSGKLESFEAYLRERLSAGVWNGAVLLRELKQRGYRAGTRF